MYNVNIKVHRVPKQYFRRFVYCKNARNVRTHLKMFVHSMSKRKPMHFNQIWPKFRNLQSFLIQLQEGTFLHFFMQHLVLAVLYEGMASVLVAPTRNLPPNKPFSSKMILQVANFYQSSLQAPIYCISMDRCKCCWGLDKVWTRAPPAESFFLLLPFFHLKLFPIVPRFLCVGFLWPKVSPGAHCLGWKSLKAVSARPVVCQPDSRWHPVDVQESS